MNSDFSIDIASIDTAVHGPVRLGILTALQVDGPLSFTTLRQRLRVADGALGTHLLKLEAIGYIGCSKQFIGRRPNSTYEITRSGREALLGYLDQMQRLIDALSKANAQARNPSTQPTINRITEP